uniref:Uncharacterized protein n=1 Tax=viral metagenome TaxID=1070528 RepID=A0A6M3ILD7_9ZZZZ
MRKIILSIFVFFCLVGTTLAAGPVIFFSDLTSAPNTGWEGSETKGAAVTIWGLNFGAAGSVVGTVNITTDSETTNIGDSDATYTVEWAVTTNNPKLDAATTLQRITFHLNSSMSADATATISVTVDGTTSNTIAFGVRAIGSNHIWFMDDNGNNSDGTTVAKAFNNLRQFDPSENANIVAGDVIYIKDGTYSTADEGSSAAIDWRTGGAIGTETSPIAFVGYPGERPKFTIPIVTVPRPADGRTTEVTYITFSKLEYESTTGVVLSYWGDGWRIINLYFDFTSYGCYQSGTIAPVNASYTHYYGNVFLNGSSDSWGHLIYPGGYFQDQAGPTDYLYFGWNEINNWNPNRGATCGHTDGSAAFNARPNSGLASFNYWYIHNNYMHDSSYGQFFYAECDNTVDNIYIYNNLLTNSNQNGAGTSRGMIFNDAGSAHVNQADMYVFNNTIYECGAELAVVWSFRDAPIHMKNNIIVESTGYKYYASNANNSQVWIDSDYDLMYGAGDEPTGAYYQITNTVSADPLFVSAVGEDFTLQAESPAIDAGADTTALFTAVSADPADLLGIVRPLDGDADESFNYDIGAYESSGDAPAGDTTDPTVTAFVIPATANSLTVLITTYTATDDVGVAYYLINESADEPAGGDAGWSAIKQTQYVFDSAGAKTLYAWAKDAAGNISASLNDGVEITLPVTIQKFGVGGSVVLMGGKRIISSP